MLAGWQAEALITKNKSVAEWIEDYVTCICTKQLIDLYRQAVTDYVRVTEKIAGDLTYSG